MLSICSRCLFKCQTLRVLQPAHLSQIRSFVSNLQIANDFSVQPLPDYEYLLDQTNLQTIRDNIANRKGVGDIDLVHSIFEKYQNNPDDSDMLERLEQAALLIPNQSCSETQIGSALDIVEQNGTVREPDGKDFARLCTLDGLLSFQDFKTSSVLFGHRSYFLIGDLAKLERALIQWTLNRLMEKGWKYVSVPDMLPETLINRCGFVTTGKQNQIYKVKPDQGGLCFAGTSEMSMAGIYAGRSMENQQPIKMCTSSQCFRAEEAKNRIDKGFYRLHQFTKVEMFGVCTPRESEELLQEIVATQCELFSELGLCYRLIRMPSEELGAAAYKKYDVEAWIKNTQHWGEISSASNCTDYQARRLAIKTPDDQFAHTVNGTGCAVPRMLMAIVEENQSEDGRVPIPECLQPYMKLTHLRPNKHISSNMKFIPARNKYF